MDLGKRIETLKVWWGTLLNHGVWDMHITELHRENSATSQMRLVQWAKTSKLFARQGAIGMAPLCPLSQLEVLHLTGGVVISHRPWLLWGPAHGIPSQSFKQPPTPNVWCKWSDYFPELNWTGRLISWLQDNKGQRYDGLSTLGCKPHSRYNRTPGSASLHERKEHSKQCLFCFHHTGLLNLLSPF